jgi:hypothetical protein
MSAGALPRWGAPVGVLRTAALPTASRLRGNALLLVGEIAVGSEDAAQGSVCTSAASSNVG